MIAVGSEYSQAQIRQLPVSKSLLSVREREILKLLSFGCTNRDISAELFISPETIKTHRAHLMRKLHARNVAMLIRRGFEYGVLTPE